MKSRATERPRDAALRALTWDYKDEDVEEVLREIHGWQVAPASPPAGSAASRRREAAAPAIGATAFLDRVQKARPLIGSYLANAKSNRREGDKLIFTFSDAFTADAVRDARAALEELAREVLGSAVTIEVEVEDEKASAAKAPPLREDPVIKSFQKHLGGEVVESRKR